MTVQIVPLAATPNQELSVVLNDRDVDIALRTLGGQTYISVATEGVAVCAGQICRDRIDLTPRAAYLGLTDLSLMFADLRGTSDPDWAEFGARYVLLSVGDPAEGPLLSLPAIPTLPLLFDGSITYNGSQSFGGNTA